MLKTGLGRSLDDLMNGRREPEKENNETGPIAGSGKNAVSPGLGAYLRPGRAGEPANALHAEVAPAVSMLEIAKPSAGLLALSLGLADAVLIFLSGCLLWNGGASKTNLLLASAAFLLAAWCGCLACWVAFTIENKR